MKNHLDQIKEIANEFAISGDFISGMEIDSGHINSTYFVEFGSDDGLKNSYVLQRINESVFPDPKAVMRNVEVVTRHINWKVLRVKRDSSGQTLNLFPARGVAFMLRSKEMGSGGATTSLRAAVLTILLRTHGRPMKQPKPSVPSKI